jgi:hypothetical protein
MHFTGATLRSCMVVDVNLTVRISPYAIGAAFVAAAPALIEPFVPPPFAPAIEIASALATAAIAAHAATRAAGTSTFGSARTMLRDVLPFAPANEGGVALGMLRFVCGVSGPAFSFARVKEIVGRVATRRLPALVGTELARRSKKFIPVAGIFLQAVRAVSNALDAAAFVTTLEALARRSADLAETRAALTHVDFPGACEPTVSAAA